MLISFFISYFLFLVAHVSIQTDNDPITDEAPEFAAKPPPCKKKEMIPSVNMFREIDRRTLEVKILLLKENLLIFIFRFHNRQGHRLKI